MPTRALTGAEAVAIAAEESDPQLGCAGGLPPGAVWSSQERSAPRWSTQSLVEGVDDSTRDFLTVATGDVLHDWTATWEGAGWSAR